MSNRREARQRVLEAIYAFEQGGGSASHVLRHLVRPHFRDDAMVLAFAEKLFLRTLENTEAANELIEERTKNWDLHRIALVDRIVLRMGITEFMAFEDIPPKVSINESIELAKRYSTDGSGRFTNGILDAIVLDLQKKGKLKKTGRGLVGMDGLGRG